MTKKRNLQFMHSTYWKSKNSKSDAIVAALKDIDTGENILQVFENPKRSIFITRPALRDQQNSKKLSESINNLDEFTIDNCMLREELQKHITGNTGGYVSQKALMNSPYVYGADIDIQVLIKQHYMNSTDKVCSKFRVGGLDIETSVLGGKEILHITYVSPELKVYTAVLDTFLDGFTDEEVLASCNKQIAEWSQKLNKKAKKICDQFKVEINIKRIQTEVDMVKWIFKQIHKDKPDFVSIWNIDYDIPYILDRLEVFNANRWDIMCHPDVPWKYRICNYRKDMNKKLQHFTHAWHMFNLSGHTQFYDGMTLLSRIRKHKGVMESYRLDMITKKFIGVGKLEHDNANHATMQKERQVDYTAYNIVDGLATVILEKVINDIPSLLMLLQDTTIDTFAQQTVQLKNWFFNYLRPMGEVPTSWQGRMLHETDEMISNVGGNVLAPSRGWRAGITRIKELIGIAEDVNSKMTLLTADIDVEAMYPRLMAAMNIDKSTKIMTILGIEGHKNTSIVDLCGHMSTPDENAVYVCSKFLGLPTYEEMLKLYDVNTSR